MVVNRKSVRRFAKSFGVGLVTFSLDLALLFLFIDVFHMYYLLSAATAFIIATSINYVLSRRYVFLGTDRPVHSGYAFFILIGVVGVCAITVLMYLFVDILHLHYIVSRVLVAFVVGWWNYLMNLYVNFRVAGK